VRAEYIVPARGLIGVRTEMLTETRGTALLHHVYEGMAPWAGEVKARRNGALVADRSGVTTGHALMSLQERGQMLVGPGVEVYEGMIVGENARLDDMVVNPRELREADPAPHAVARAGPRDDRGGRVRRGHPRRGPAAQGHPRPAH